MDDAAAGDRQAVVAGPAVQGDADAVGVSLVNLQRRRFKEPFRANLRGAGMVLDAGLDAQVSDRVSLYGDVGYRFSFNGRDESIKGQVGVKVRF